MQATRSDYDVSADGVVSAINVNGDNLTVMGRFDQTPEVSFVNLVAAPTGLFPKPAWWPRHLLSPTFEATLLWLIFYDNRLTQNNVVYSFRTCETGGPPGGSGADTPVAVGHGIPLVRRPTWLLGLSSFHTARAKGLGRLTAFPTISQRQFCLPSTQAHQRLR